MSSYFPLSFAVKTCWCMIPTEYLGSNLVKIKTYTEPYTLWTISLKSVELMLICKGQHIWVFVGL